MSAERVAGGMYAVGTGLLSMHMSLQTIRIGGDGVLTDEDRRRLTRMSQTLAELAGELHSRGTRIARDHQVENYPPEVEL
jgi:hypothetical protein